MPETSSLLLTRLFDAFKDVDLPESLTEPSPLTPAETGRKAIMLLTWLSDAFKDIDLPESLAELFADVNAAVVKFYRRQCVDVFQVARYREASEAVSMLTDFYKQHGNSSPGGEEERCVSLALAFYLRQSEPVAVSSEGVRCALQDPKGGPRAAALTRVAEVLGMSERTLRRRFRETIEGKRPVIG